MAALEMDDEGLKALVDTFMRVSVPMVRSARFSTMRFPAGPSISTSSPPSGGHRSPAAATKGSRCRPI
jgi:hypothetical protein